MSDTLEPDELDDQIDELRAAVEAHDPLPGDLVAAAKAGFAARSLDVELAELTFDSLLEPGGVRDASAGSRVLSFVAPAGSIEVVVADGRLVGQLVPPAGGTVELRTGSGPALVADADDAGTFSFAVARRAVVQLRATVGGSATATDWFRV